MTCLKFDAYDGMSFFGGLVFFAPVALLVRTQAGISDGQFFLLQVLLSAVIALGELPTGYLTDCIGYRSSLILSQLLLLTARGILLAAYLFRSLPLFVLEAVIEGISACLSSGTGRQRKTTTAAAPCPGGKSRTERTAGPSASARAAAGAKITPCERYLCGVIKQTAHMW